MSIEGLIVVGCILTIFAMFAATLAWGVHQTRLAQRDKERSGNVVDMPTKEQFASDTRSRAA